MKVVILAGGLGTRLSEHTETIPKPLVPIGARPILWHIMNSYAGQGFNEFIIALGYKGEKIKDYFLKYHALNSDLTVDLSNGKLDIINGSKVNWKITLIDTGESTLTGGRLKRLKSVIGDERFLLTYGDGVSDVDISGLIRQHEQGGKMITLTAVRPPSRFGQLLISECDVLDFNEKPQMHDGWINGGFFVVEPEFLSYIEGDGTMLEREPLERAVRNTKLGAYKHYGFWQCVDTKRDLERLNSMWASNDVPWARFWKRD